MPDPLDIEELLNRAGNGDPDACGELLGRYQARLRRLIALRWTAG